MCDVNGCSFVKKSTKFYDDCSSLLYNMILKNTFIFRNNKYASTDKERSEKDMMKMISTKVEVKTSTSAFGTVDEILVGDDDGSEAVEEDESRELRCVIAVLRHGDRTPKQKLKMKIRAAPLLSFIDTYGSDQRKELKLKSAKQLTEFLDALKGLMGTLSRDEGDSDDEYDSFSKYDQVIQVLEMGGGFSGINRKIQIKPLSWGNKKYVFASVS